MREGQARTGMTKGLIELFFTTLNINHYFYNTYKIWFR